ncbi:MAG: hypothetical protein AB4911_13120 [Oscillochloridaceae bacterium umkhey_bin13]
MRHTLARVVLTMIFALTSLLLPTVTRHVQAAEQPIAEQEPNHTPETAQSLANIGAEHPVTAQINSAGDVDWYQINVEIGRTYVVEAFDTVRGLAAQQVYTCSGLFYSIGLRITVYTDPDVPAVVDQCGLGGGGRVHTYAEFQADRSGPFLIRIQAHATNLTGSYRLRILPKFNEPGASWDGTTFEPNNHATVAYAITAGGGNRYTTEIEEVSGIYSRRGGDVDFFRFTAEANTEYIVELLDVADTLATERVYTCSGLFTSKGLRVTIYNPANDQVTDECFLNRTSDTRHTPVRFTTNRSGTFSIRVLPHDSDAFGSYTLRVRPVSEEYKVFLPLTRR